MPAESTRRAAILAILAAAIVGGCHATPTAPVRVVPQLGTAAPRRVAYSPGSGDRLLVVEASGRLQVWNVGDLKQPVLFATIGAGAIDAAFSADGATIVSGGRDGRIRWWSVDGQPLAVSESAHDGGVRAVAPGQDFTVAGDEAGAIKLWRNDGRALAEVATGRSGPVVSLARAADGDILSVDADGSLWRWKAAGTGDALRFEAALVAKQRKPNDPTAYKNAMTWDPTWGWDHSVVVAPDGSIGAAFFDGALRVFAGDGTPRATIADAHRKRQLRALAFSQRGDLLASAGFDGTVRIWNPDGTARGAPISGHVNNVYSVSFNPAGDGIATTGADDRVRFWDLQGAQRGELPAAEPPLRAPIAVAPQTAAVAFPGSGGAVRICPLGAADCVGPLPSAGKGVASLAFSADGAALVAATSDGAIETWTAAGEKRGETIRPAAPHQTFVVFADGDERLAIGSDILSVRGPQGVLWQIGGQPADLYSRIAMSPRGDLLAVGTLLGFTGIWNVDGTLVGRVTRLPRENVVGLVFAPNGQSVLTAGGYENVVRSRLIDGTPGPTLEGHRGAVTALAVSPERGLVASASTDGAIRIWELPQERAVIAAGLPIDQVGFVRDLLWARADRAVLLYDRDWHLVAAAELLPDGLLVYTPDGWFAGPPSAAGIVRVFDATGRELSPSQRARRASLDRVAAALGPSVSAQSAEER